jgi:hypothetical protein
MAYDLIVDTQMYNTHGPEIKTLGILWHGHLTRLLVMMSLLLRMNVLAATSENTTLRETVYSESYEAGGCHLRSKPSTYINA